MGKNDSHSIKFNALIYVSGTQYDAILFDMDSKDRTLGLSCPPQTFLHDHVLENVTKILTNTGNWFNVLYKISHNHMNGIIQ